MTSPSRWYTRPFWLALWIGLIGPLALPMVWSSPYLTRPIKWTISIVVIGLTVWIAAAAFRIGLLTFQRLKTYPDLSRLLNTLGTQ